MNEELRRATKIYRDFTGRAGSTVETWDAHESLDGIVGARFGFLDHVVIDAGGQPVTVGFEGEGVGLGASHDGRQLVILGTSTIPERWQARFLRASQLKCLRLGTILAIAYNTLRNGRRERYIHDFNRASRPDLYVTRDGYWLIIGGDYEFLDTGINDRG